MTLACRALFVSLFGDARGSDLPPLGRPPRGAMHVVFANIVYSHYAALTKCNRRKADEFELSFNCSMEVSLPGWPSG